MAEIEEILKRLRCQHAEVAGLAADAIERLVASEAEARASLAQAQEQSIQLMAKLRPMAGEECSGAALARRA